MAALGAEAGAELLSLSLPPSPWPWQGAPEGSAWRGCPLCPCPFLLSPVLRCHPTRGRCAPTLWTSDTSGRDRMGTAAGTCTVRYPCSCLAAWDGAGLWPLQKALPLPHHGHQLWAEPFPAPLLGVISGVSLVPAPQDRERLSCGAFLPPVLARWSQGSHCKGVGAACLQWRPCLQDLYHFLPSYFFLTEAFPGDYSGDAACVTAELFAGK